MSRFKYIDKKILCSYDLSEELFLKLGLKVYDIIPLRKIFILFTDKGKKILKINNSSVQRINFINDILNIIKEKDEYILQYCKNSNKEIITKWKGKTYVLLDMIDGREANFTNPIEVELCTKALANFHNASINITDKLKQEDILLNKSENLIDEFSNDLVFLKEAEKIINKFNYKNEFDILFLNNVSKAKKDLNIAINLLRQSKYNNLYSDIRKKVICHLDLAHHNFIIDDDKINMIDFDYCKVDIKVADIYNFIIKVIKKYAYDKEMIDKIIKDYSSISKLTDEEIKIIYILINYPKDFINISKDYYLKQKSWDYEVFLSRFKTKIENDIFRSDLLKEINENLI